MKLKPDFLDKRLIDCSTQRDALIIHTTFNEFKSFIDFVIKIINRIKECVKHDAKVKFHYNILVLYAEIRQLS